MAIRYSETESDIRSIWRYDKTDDAHTIIGYTSTDYDIIPLDSEVGDGIVFALYNYYTGKIRKIKFLVDSNVVADNIQGVWEYYTVIDTNSYANSEENWKPLQNVIDSGNNFTTNQDGVIEVEWDVPEDWDNYCNPGGDTSWYSFNIRYRITEIDNITETGRITNTKCFGNNIEVIDQDFRMEDLYQADIENGWGKITRNGYSDYILNCGLHIDSTSNFISQEETITFIHNHCIVNNGRCTLGIINAVGMPDKGTTIRFESANADFSACYLGINYSQYLGLTIQFPQEPRSIRQHGFWGGGIGDFPEQTIMGGNFYNFRNYKFSHPSNLIKGLTYYNAHTEPAGAIIDGIKVVDSGYGIRPNTLSNYIIVHRVNFEGTTRANTNPWRVSGIEDWWNGYVDSVFNEDLPLSRFYQNSTDDNSYVNNYRVIDFKSFITQVKDTELNVLNDVNVCVYNNRFEEVLNAKTNNDGFASEYRGTVNSIDGNKITFNDFKDTSTDAMRYYEIYVTNGPAYKDKRIIMYSTENTLTTAESLSSIPEENDRFIEVPYIKYRWQRPAKDQTSGYGYSDIEYQGDFKIRYRKYGYLFMSVTEDFKNPVNSIITLFNNNDIILSLEDALNISGITVTLEDDPIIENDKEYSITIDCGNNTLNDAWHYLQAFFSQPNNIFYHNMLKRNEDIFYTEGGYYNNGDSSIFKGVRVINYSDGMLNKVQSDDGSYYYLPVIVKIIFEITEPLVDYEYRIYEVPEKGSLEGSVELQGIESTSDLTHTYVYEYVENKNIAIQILPHDNDYLETIIYTTLNDKDQNISIEMKRDEYN